MVVRTRPGKLWRKALKTKAYLALLTSSQLHRNLRSRLAGPVFFYGGRRCDGRSGLLPFARIALQVSGRFRRSGTNTEMGPSLPRVFQEAGLLAPSTHTDTLLGSEPWLPECLHSLRPQIAQLGLSLEPLGDFETFSERLQTEVTAFKTTTPLPDLVSAWSRKPVREGVC